MRLVILDSRLESLKNSFNSNIEVFIVNKNKTKSTEIYDFIKNKKYDSVAYMAHYQSPIKHHICADIRLNLRDKNDRIKLTNFWKHFDTPVIDYLGCSLLSNNIWKSTFLMLEKNLSKNVRASDDNTGNMKAGGDWVMESDNINVKDLYFNSTIENWSDVLALQETNELLISSTDQVLVELGDGSNPTAVTETSSGIILEYTDAKEISQDPDTLEAYLQKEEDFVDENALTDVGSTIDPGTLDLVDEDELLVSAPESESTGLGDGSNPTAVTETSSGIILESTDAKEISQDPDPLEAYLQKEEDFVDENALTDVGSTITESGLDDHDGLDDIVKTNETERAEFTAPDMSGPDNDEDGLGEYEDPNDNNPDIDNDGLLDGAEIYGTDNEGNEHGFGFTNLTMADTDGDGLLDGAEVDGTDNYGDEHGYGPTDPNNPDTDVDGLTDGDEVHEYITDPTKTDTDGDGLLDEAEVNGTDNEGNEHEYGPTDPTMADIDEDGLNDFEEVSLNTDPYEPDTDEDGLLDVAEVKGTDNYGDEHGYGPTDPNNPDIDDDGLLDGAEINGTDNEEYEHGFGSTDPTKADTDEDGLTDFEEVYERGTAPTKADIDEDGLNDLEEVSLGTYPYEPDTDDDGLTDGEEVNIFETDPTINNTTFVYNEVKIEQSGPISENITVENGGTLIIEAGVTINFKGSFILVREGGTIIVNGTENEPVNINFSNDNNKGLVIIGNDPINHIDSNTKLRETHFITFMYGASQVADTNNSFINYLNIKNSNLYLYAVGSNTEMNRISVRNDTPDKNGIEIYGGSVNLDNLYIDSTKTGLLINHGWSGSISRTYMRSVERAIEINGLPSNPSFEDILVLTENSQADVGIKMTDSSNMSINKLTMLGFTTDIEKTSENSFEIDGASEANNFKYVSSNISYIDYSWSGISKNYPNYLTFSNDNRILKFNHESAEYELKDVDNNGTYNVKSKLLNDNYYSTKEYDFSNSNNFVSEEIEEWNLDNDNLNFKILNNDVDILNLDGTQSISKTDMEVISDTINDIFKGPFNNQESITNINSYPDSEETYLITLFEQCGITASVFKKLDITIEEMESVLNKYLAKYDLLARETGRDNLKQFFKNSKSQDLFNLIKSNIDQNEDWEDNLATILKLNYNLPANYVYDNIDLIDDFGKKIISTLGHKFGLLETQENINLGWLDSKSYIMLVLFIFQMKLNFQKDYNKMIAYLFNLSDYIHHTGEKINGNKKYNEFDSLMISLRLVINYITTNTLFDLSEIINLSKIDFSRYRQLIPDNDNDNVGNILDDLPENDKGVRISHRIVYYKTKHNCPRKCKYVKKVKKIM